MNTDDQINQATTKVEDALNNLINRDKIELPLLPEVAGKVVQLTQDPDSDAAELAHLIEGDVTLASHVMRIANSAAYSPNTSIVSLQQAITRLGMKLISEIALAASVNSTLFDAPEYIEHIKSILKFSLASGLWSKEVARSCRKNVEVAFIGGLLHDIGRPIVIQSVSKITKKLGCDIPLKSVMNLEDKYQRNLGEKAVTEWKMPKAIIEVVKFFDDYSVEHDSQFQTMIAFAGKVIASHVVPAAQGCYCMSLEDVRAHPIFAELNIYSDELDTILAKKDRVLQALEAMSQ